MRVDVLEREVVVNFPILVMSKYYFLMTSILHTSAMVLPRDPFQINNKVEIMINLDLKF